MTKFLGGFIAIAGSLLLAFALNFEVTVASAAGGRINNIGLMDDRQNMLIVACLMVVVGTLGLLFAKPAQPAFERSGVSTEEVRREVRTQQQYQGERDLGVDEYMLYLTRKYKVERNETLGKFVMEDRVYPDLDAVMLAAHEREDDAIAKPGR